MPTLAQPSNDEVKGDEFRCLQEADPYKSKTSGPPTDTWKWEFIAITFSVLCFLAILCVVWAFDNKPSPTIYAKLTLNTIISILATASKSSLIFAVGSCLGQLKWLWFSKSAKRLQDMQVFDDATRGPWGSAIMLFRHTGGILPSLGAFITILSLSFDPFMQQTVTLPVKQKFRQSDLATTSQVTSNLMGIASMFPPRTQGGFDLNGQHKMSFQDSVVQGIWATEFNVSPSCPSVNCTWPDFKSIGFCHKCADVTTSATLTGCEDIPYPRDENGLVNVEGSTTPWSKNCTLSLPSGNPLNVTISLKGDDSPTLNSDTTYALSLPAMAVWEIFRLPQSHMGMYKDGPPANYSFLGIDNPMIVMGHVEFDILLGEEDADATFHIGDIYNQLRYPEKGFQMKKVTECVLSLCSRAMNVSVTNGKPDITTSSPNFGQISFIKQAYPGFEEDGKLSSIPHTSDGHITACWQEQKVTEISDHITGHLSSLAVMYESGTSQAFCQVDAFTPEVQSYIAGHQEFELFAWVGQKWWVMKNTHEPGHVLHGSKLGDGQYTGAGFNRVAEVGFEAIMSNIAASLTEWGLRNVNASFRGMAMVTEVLVVVHWPWLILPSILVVFSIIFLVLTVQSNRCRGQYLWKTSLLPAFYHGLQDQEMHNDKDLSLLSDMERSAGATSAILEFCSVRGRYMMKVEEC